MSEEARRTWLEAFGAIILMALAGLMTLLAGMAIVFLLPATVLIIAFNFGDLWLPGGIVRWIALLWFPAAFVAAVYVVVTGLEAMEDPRLGQVTRLLLLPIFIFFSFPPFWLST